MDGTRFNRAIGAALVAFALSAGTAGAAGTTQVTQSDGATKIYHNVSMALNGQTLRLRSQDRRGVLEVSSSACSMVGSLQRCLPYLTTLRQQGKTHEIELKRGAVVFNMTGETQPLRYSSKRIGPHEVMILLHTMRGTIISAEGTLDNAK